MFDGMLATVDYQLQQFLPDRPDGKRYYRLQAQLRGPAEIDDTDSTAIRNLRLAGKQVIDNLDAVLDTLCKQLAA